MSDRDEIIFSLILAHAKRLGRTKAHTLIDQFGSAKHVIQAGWDSKQRLLFSTWEVGSWEEDLRLAEQEGVTLIPYRAANYPKNLLNLPGSPLILYIKGQILPSDDKSLALVGTRNATLYGKQQAEKIAKELASSGMTIISGLARGIDTAAHEGALKAGGRTLAVIGSGLCHVYPPENRHLGEKISSSGALLSEFPMKTVPTKSLFPQRNRTVSALSLGVCLVESPREGGGMITMQCGEEFKQPLFALPGRLDWPTFEGNHLLIKQKRAQLIENGEDILNFFKIPPSQHPIPTFISSLSKEETAFLAKMPCEEKSIDELVLLTQLPVMQLNILLTRLILKKVVKEFPGKIYKKNYNLSV